MFDEDIVNDLLKNFTKETFIRDVYGFHQNMTNLYINSTKFDCCVLCQNIPCVSVMNAAYALKDNYALIKNDIEEVLEMFFRLELIKPIHAIISFIYYKRIIETHQHCRAIGVILANPIYGVATFTLAWKIFDDEAFSYDFLLKCFRDVKVNYSKKSLAKAEFTVFDLIKNNYRVN